MMSICETLNKIFADAIAEAYPDIPDPPVVVTTSTNPKFGDYQYNSAMSLSKLISSQGKFLTEK